MTTVMLHSQDLAALRKILRQYAAVGRRASSVRASPALLAVPLILIWQFLRRI